jgi:hypothetical protein
VKVPVNEDFLFDVDIERRELAPHTGLAQSTRSERKLVLSRRILSAAV